jgi:predicted nuclease of predicted toxin-antitoxin system
MPWKPLEYEKPTKEETRRILARASFYADHNLDSAFIEMLRHLGWTVETAAEIGAASQSDAWHFRRAFKTNRVLLTMDKDFLDDKQYPFSQTRGILIFNIDSSSPDEIARALEVVHYVLGQIAATLDEKKVLVNSDYTFRIISRVRDGTEWTLRTNRYRVDADGAWIWDEES